MYRTIEADDVWQDEAARECGPARVLGTDEWGSCREAGSPLRKDRFLLQRSSSGGWRR
jgi:hypothetical protein